MSNAVAKGNLCVFWGLLASHRRQISSLPAQLCIGCAWRGNVSCRIEGQMSNIQANLALDVDCKMACVSWKGNIEAKLAMDVCGGDQEGGASTMSASSASQPQGGSPATVTDAQSSAGNTTESGTSLQESEAAQSDLPTEQTDATDISRASPSLGTLKEMNGSGPFEHGEYGVISEELSGKKAPATKQELHSKDKPSVAENEATAAARAEALSVNGRGSGVEVPGANQHQAASFKDSAIGDNSSPEVGLGETEAPPASAVKEGANQAERSACREAGSTAAVQDATAAVGKTLELSDGSDVESTSAMFATHVSPLEHQGELTSADAASDVTPSGCGSSGGIEGEAASYAVLDRSFDIARAIQWGPPGIHLFPTAGLFREAASGFADDQSFAYSELGSATHLDTEIPDTISVVSYISEDNPLVAQHKDSVEEPKQHALRDDHPPSRHLSPLIPGTVVGLESGMQLCMDDHHFAGYSAGQDTASSTGACAASVSLCGMSDPGSGSDVEDEAAMHDGVSPPGPSVNFSEIQPQSPADIAAARAKVPKKNVDPGPVLPETYSADKDSKSLASYFGLEWPDDTTLLVLGALSVAAAGLVAFTALSGTGRYRYH
jgi:hypothetical protein